LYRWAVKLPDVLIIKDIFVVIPVDKAIVKRVGMDNGRDQKDHCQQHSGMNFGFGFR
jgi:hypothetical protein